MFGGLAHGFAHLVKPSPSARGLAHDDRRHRTFKRPLKR